MSSIAFYRKYRPNNFNTVIGQKFIIDSLKNQVKNQNFYHAYIFSGTRGSGKTTLARIMSKAINCLNPEDGECCNQCQNCLNIINSNPLDILEIDAASNSGVEEIRKLIETINYLPSSLKKKVYIIDEAHMLSNSAWNALLKTIEDPPNYITFIFATTEVNKIPMTIMSRCQRFDFQKLTIGDLKNLINYVCEKEKILISNEVIVKISQFADGSARDSLSILSQLSTYANNNITIEHINQIFNLTSIDFKIKLINNIFNKNELLEVLKELNKITNNYLVLAKEIIDIIIDKLVINFTNNPNLLSFISLSQSYEITLNQDDLFNLLDIFTNIYEKIKLYGRGDFYFKSNLLKINCQSKVCDQKHDTNSINSNASANKSIANNLDKFDCFSTNIFSINNLNKSLSKPNNTLELKENIDNNPLKISLEIDFKEIFKRIASNSDKKIKEDIRTKIINGTNALPNNLQLINNAKVLIASKNAALLMFEFKSEANEFNNIFWEKNSYLSLKDHIFKNHDYLLIASDKTTILDWREDLLKDKSEYHDVDLSIIKPLTQQSDDQKIKNILKIMNEEE